MDYIADPKTKVHYHPGVSLSVYNFFGEVSVWEGFWAMRKKDGHWEKVELPIASAQHVIIPEHLLEKKTSNYLRFCKELYEAEKAEERSCKPTR